MYVLAVFLSLIIISLPYFGNISNTGTRFNGSACVQSRFINVMYLSHIQQNILH